jgi:hypothetical protein
MAEVTDVDITAGVPTAGTGTVKTINELVPVAHDGVDSGRPLKIGAKAVAALSAQTPVAADDRTNNFADLDGALLTKGYTTFGDIVAGTASNTDGTSTEVIAAAAAGIKQYLTDVSLDNQSATDIYVELKSGTTVRWHLGLPAKSSHSKHFDPPLPPNAAAEAWNFDPSAAATTVYCSALGFKSKV